MKNFLRKIVQKRNFFTMVISDTHLVAVQQSLECTKFKYLRRRSIFFRIQTPPAWGVQFF
eukprot:UN14710